jgi:hypothetical protein
MNRLLVLALGGGLLIGAAGLVIATAEQDRGPFIGTGQPVTEDQVRQKLQSDGWSDVRIRREGRYFEATGTKDGQANQIAVDSQTGRLRADEDDDDQD